MVSDPEATLASALAMLVLQVRRDTILQATALSGILLCSNR